MRCMPPDWVDIIGVYQPANAARATVPAADLVKRAARVAIHIDHDELQLVSVLSKNERRKLLGSVVDPDVASEELHAPNFAP